MAEAAEADEHRGERRLERRQSGGYDGDGRRAVEVAAAVPMEEQEEAVADREWAPEQAEQPSERSERSLRNRRRERPPRRTAPRRGGTRGGETASRELGGRTLQRAPTDQTNSIIAGTFPTPTRTSRRPRPTLSRFATNSLSLPVVGSANTRDSQALQASQAPKEQFAEQS